MDSSLLQGNDSLGTTNKKSSKGPKVTKKVSSIKPGHKRTQSDNPTAGGVKKLNKENNNFIYNISIPEQQLKIIT